MSRRIERNVGVIGLGIIGSRVAETLRRRGFSVFVWNRTPRPFPNFVGSPAEMAQITDFLQIFVSDDDALLQVVEQLKPALKAHHVVMAHCTVAPHSMRAAAEIVQRRGAQFLDAPFTGSKVAAGNGELVYYIAGDEVAFKRARPVLEGSSKEIIEIGEIGQATLIKIATNMVTAVTVQVAAEALALVDNLGLGRDKFVAAMRGNASNSATLTMKLPKMIEGDFEPHFSVKHMLKDMQIASRLGRSHGLTLSATEAARSSLLEEERQNRGDYDYTSMVHAFFPAGPAPQPVVETEEPELPTLELDQTQEPETSEPAATADPLEPAPNEPTALEEIVTSDAPAAENSEEILEPAPQQSETVVAAETEAAEATPEAEVPVAAEEETERRGFFSRMFGKSSNGQDADY